ncbi:MAG TPA: hypothetical protein VLS88_01880 [Polyangiales bacterium]|nr:hypothetical protein [Polyangiales bacterium]
MNERRRRRSQDPYRALCLQLEHSRSEGELDAMVVATDDGLVVAGAGERSVCEALGAIAPLFGSPSFNGPMPGSLVGQSIGIRPLILDGEMMYVASAGRSDGDRWIQSSIRGVCRILGYQPPRESQLLVN